MGSARGRSRLSTPLLRIWVDVAASPHPVRARTSKADGVFYLRMTNSTRALPDDEIAPYPPSRRGPPV
ncbi:hypothetical protein BH23ACT2_BH23ACT2_03280 [soil metagenome]